MSPSTAKSQSPVEELTEATVDGFVRRHRFAIVDAYATWCAPCHALEPHFRALAAEFDGRVAFGRVDVDASPDYAARHHVQNLPTLLLYRDGVVAGRVIGFVRPDRLRSELERLAA